MEMIPFENSCWVIIVLRLDGDMMLYHDSAHDRILFGSYEDMLKAITLAKTRYQNCHYYLAEVKEEALTTIITKTTVFMNSLGE